MAASLVDCHSGNDQNDVKLCFVEEDDLLANPIEYIQSHRGCEEQLYFDVSESSQEDSNEESNDEETAVEIVFVDLEWPRVVKHNVDTDLSEPYRRNVNNRELNHV